MEYVEEQNGYIYITDLKETVKFTQLISLTTLEKKPDNTELSSGKDFLFNGRMDQLAKFQSDPRYTFCSQMQALTGYARVS